MNIWSNGDQFTGMMRIGRQAEVHIGWIEIIYDTNESSPGSKVLCAVDAGAVGQLVMISSAER